MATRSSFEAPAPETVALVEQLPEDATRHPPDLRVLNRETDGSTLIALPRYAPFTADAQHLALQRVEFREIAGNRDAILITVIAPRD